MSSIGQRLRDERLRKGLSIEQVAENTRISQRYLEALESGDLDRIPGKFFARSFLRQYARALGVDERELTSELDRLTEAEPLPTLEALDQSGRNRIDIEPVPGEGIPRVSQRTWASLGVFVLMVLACSLIYVLFQRTRQEPAPETPPQQQAAQQQSVQQSTPVEKQVPAPEQPAGQNPASASASPETARPAETTKPAESTAPGSQPAQQASAPAAVPPATSGAPQGTGAVRLQLAATEPAWVRVTVDGKVVMANTLLPGVTKNFDGSQTILLRSGNAGALEVSYNGKAVGPIGPKGQIRTVEFTPSEFHRFIPPPKPAEEP